jgi:hypothetical protein
MEKIRLILKFTVAGEGDCRVRGAARITVDGHGGLTVHEPGSGAVERIELARLQTLSIQPITGAGRAA